jgi:hypothetical protein
MASSLPPRLMSTLLCFFYHFITYYFILIACAYNYDIFVTHFVTDSNIPPFVTWSIACVLRWDMRFGL